MLSLSSSIPIWLCVQPTDMRKSFNGLMGVVQSVMQLDPLTGHLFVFRNKAGDKLKVLYWDCDGLAIEMHQDPEHAMTDGAQSITPAVLAELMKSLQRVAEAVDKECIPGAGRAAEAAVR